MLYHHGNVASVQEAVDHSAVDIDRHMVEHGNAAGIGELGIEIIVFRHFKEETAQDVGFEAAIIPLLL